MADQVSRTSQSGLKSRACHPGSFGIGYYAVFFLLVLIPIIGSGNGGYDALGRVSAALMWPYSTLVVIHFWRSRDLLFQIPWWPSFVFTYWIGIIELTSPEYQVQIRLLVACFMFVLAALAFLVDQTIKFLKVLYGKNLTIPQWSVIVLDTIFAFVLAMLISRVTEDVVTARDTDAELRLDSSILWARVLLILALLRGIQVGVWSVYRRSREIHNEAISIVNAVSESVRRREPRESYLLWYNPRRILPFSRALIAMREMIFGVINPYIRRLVPVLVFIFIIVFYFQSFSSFSLQNLVILGAFASAFQVFVDSVFGEKWIQRGCEDIGDSEACALSVGLLYALAIVLVLALCVSGIVLSFLLSVFIGR